MAEVTFEQKFGQLVDAQLNEKLPSLVKYRVGFQVIDKSEDETKAVGVAAFIVKNVWLYIPAFFLEGDIKGLDLLYHKQLDLFIPAMDNWIQSLEEQGTQTLGFMRDHPNTHNMSKADEFSTPQSTVVYEGNLELGKAASWIDEFNDVIEKEAFEKMIAFYGDYELPIGSFMDELPDMGKTASAAYVHNMARYPELMNGMLRFYSIEDIQKTAEAAAARAVIPKESKQEGVEIFTKLDKTAADALDPMSKRLLVRHGMYVKDSRTNLSKVFQSEIDTSVMQNPSHPGIYDCYLADGTYKTMVVVFPKCFDQGNDNFSRHRSNVGRNIALIDPSRPKDYISKKNFQVYCKPSTNLTANDMDSVEGGYKATKRGLRDIKKGTRILLIQSPKYAVETHVIDISPDGSVFVANSAGDGYKDRGLHPDQDIDKVMIQFVNEHASLRVVGDKLFVPEGTRLFTAPPADKQIDPNNWAGPETIYQVMHKQAGLHSLEVFYSGGDTAQIKTPYWSSGLLSKEAAVRSLCVDHGIKGGEAMLMIKDAARNEGKSEWYIKYAAPYDLAAYGASKPPFQGGPVGQQEYAQTTTITSKPALGLTGPQDADNNPIMPKEVIDRAMQASEAGIKEVFDVKVMQGLVEKSDISELRKDYLKDMSKGMDKVGRMLFLFYWHNEEFEEKYGSDDMGHLEDTLKEVFHSLGDLVLFLKEKTAYNPDIAESLFGALSEDIGTAGAAGDAL